MILSLYGSLQLRFIVSSSLDFQDLLHKIQTLPNPLDSRGFSLKVPGNMSRS